VGRYLRCQSSPGAESAVYADVSPGKDVSVHLLIAVLKSRRASQCSRRQGQQFRICLVCGPPPGGRITRYTLPVSLSVRLSVPCPPSTPNRKTVQRSNLEENLSRSGVTDRAVLRSKGQTLRSVTERKKRCPNVASATDKDLEHRDRDKIYTL